MGTTTPVHPTTNTPHMKNLAIAWTPLDLYLTMGPSTLGPKITAYRLVVTERGKEVDPRDLGLCGATMFRNPDGAVKVYGNGPSNLPEVLLYDTADPKAPECKIQQSVVHHWLAKTRTRVEALRTREQLARTEHGIALRSVHNAEFDMNELRVLLAETQENDNQRSNA